MNLLVKQLIEKEKFKQYLSNIKNDGGPISLSGLSDVGKAHMVSATMNNTNRPACIITYNEIQAKKILRDLEYFLDDNIDIIYFPKKEISAYDYISQSKDLLFERIKVLNKIYENKKCIIVTTIEAIMQEIPKMQMIYKNVISF